jgi:hypothetical protein
MIISIRRLETHKKARNRRSSAGLRKLATVEQLERRLIDECFPQINRKQTKGVSAVRSDSPGIHQKVEAIRDDDVMV